MLAFITFKEGEHTLWTLSPEGEQKQLIVRDTVEIDSPVWSPDGGAIYYERMVEARSWEIWKAPISGDGTASGAPERILSGLSIGKRFAVVPSISISADGTKLLYIRAVAHSNLWLYQLDRAGTDGITASHQLTTGTALRHTPRLSPSGEEITFVQSEARGSNVFTMPVDGGPETQVTSSDADTWSPSWSPDGTAIAFGSIRDGEPMIGVVNVHGGASRTLADDRFESGNLVAWGPASRITYQHPGDQNYGSVDPATGEEFALIPDTSYGWQYDPRPSPDGKWVAVYWNRGGMGQSGIWLLSTEGQEPAPLTEGLIAVGWSADARTIYAFETNDRRTQVRELYAIDVASRDTRLIATLPEDVMPWNVSISPDGRRLIAAVEERQSDAWIIENFDPGGD